MFQRHRSTLQYPTKRKGVGRGIGRERETSFCENDGGGEGGGGFPHIPAMFDKSGGGGRDWQEK